MVSSEFSYADFGKHVESPFKQVLLERLEKKKVLAESPTVPKTGVDVSIESDEGGETLVLTKTVLVDRSHFTKVFDDFVNDCFNLSEKSRAMWGYINSKLVTDKDEAVVSIEELMEAFGYKTKRSVYLGLTDLLRNGLIAKGSSDCKFYVNPVYAFRGDRVKYARTIQRESI